MKKTMMKILIDVTEGLPHEFTGFVIKVIKGVEKNTTLTEQELMNLR